MLTYMCTFVEVAEVKHSQGHCHNH